MKKISILALGCFVAFAAHAQITINSSDIPVPNGPAAISDLSTTVTASPTKGTNQLWDYGNKQGVAATANDYPLETDAFFTAAGIDIRLDGTKSFNANFSYYMSNGWDFHAQGIDDKGYYVPAQGYDLQSFTSNILDSLKIPEQKTILSSPRRLWQFPMTMGSAWSSNSRRITNFTLTVASYALNNAPAQHAYTIYRTDSIVGWGKLSIYTPNGPSAAYDVLMDKVSSYAIDSFYLNNAPAPTALLTAFNVSQGSKSGVQHFYNFLRKGSLNYFMRFAYGADSTYTTPTGVYVNTDFAYPTQNESVNQNEIQLVTFPNPVSGNNLQVMYQSTQTSEIQYTLHDLFGRIMAQSTLRPNQLQSIPINNQLANGMYMLRGVNNQQEQVFVEEIQVQR